MITPGENRVIYDNTPARPTVRRICEDSGIEFQNSEDLITFKDGDVFFEDSFCLDEKSDVPDFVKRFSVGNHEFDTKDHLEESLIGKFFKECDLEFDYHIVACSISELFPSRGYSQDFDDMSAKQYSDFREAFISQESKHAMRDIVSMKDTLSARLIGSNIIDMRESKMNPVIKEAAMFYGLAYMTADWSKGVISFRGNVLSNTLFWISRWVRDSGYKVGPVNRTRQTVDLFL